MGPDGGRRCCQEARGLLRDQCREVTHLGLEPRSDSTACGLSKASQQAWLPAVAWEIFLPWAVLSPAGFLEARTQQFSRSSPWPPHPVPYGKDHLSHRYHVQLAVEILNPRAQFFFPTSNKAKEVFCGHYLVRTWRKKATGSRLRAGRLTPCELQEPAGWQGHLLAPWRPLTCREGPVGVGSPGLALSGGSTAAADPSLMGHREFYSWF